MKMNAELKKLRVETKQLRGGLRDATNELHSMMGQIFSSIAELKSSVRQESMPLNCYKADLKEGLNFDSCEEEMNTKETLRDGEEERDEEATAAKPTVPSLKIQILEAMNAQITAVPLLNMGSMKILSTPTQVTVFPACSVKDAREETNQMQESDKPEESGTDMMEMTPT